MPDVRPQIGGDEAIAIGGKLDGVQAGLFAGEFLAELEHPAADLLQAEHGRRRRSPRHEVHAEQELEDAEGVDPIGLGAGEPGALEVLDGSRVHDHDLAPCRALQGERQVEAVDAGGFQADASDRTPAGEQAQELPMAGGGVGRVQVGSGWPSRRRATTSSVAPTSRPA
jgi:hypothetical protein